MEENAYSGTSILRSTTDPAWAKAAVLSINETLIDHAHCEKKAAVAAMSLIASYLDDADLIRTMTALAADELSHFREVFELLSQRGVPLGRDPGDPYAQALLALVRQPARQRKLDRMLISALIEARSCERFQLLATELERSGCMEDAAAFRRFERSEAGHAALFMRLALREGRDVALARLEELAVAEAAIVARLPVVARIH